MKLSALIVDDEYPAREEIRYHLEKYKNITIVGEAASVSEASTLIKAIHYDLVFLDINFPLKNGIELGLEIMQLKSPPFIIYVTAYEKYALKAFDVNAIDYLLKPINPEIFDRAISRVYEAIMTRRNNIGVFQKSNTETPPDDDQNRESSALSGTITRISAELNGNITLVDINDVQYAYSEDSYIFIKVYGDKLITRYTLQTLEEKLNNANFFRIHRRYLVNLDKVKEISPGFKGSCHLIMSDKEKSYIPVSRRQARELKKFFDF
jgi:two-component system, LytTR family, response regulator